MSAVRGPALGVTPQPAQSVTPQSVTPLETVAETQRRFAVWAVASTFAVLAGIVAASLYRTRGHLAYVLDDAAIHLSMARNLALHGTWGVVPHHYQSASSSPVWTLLLALFARITPRTTFEYVPLVLSAVAGAWLLVSLARAQHALATRAGHALQFAAVAAIGSGVLFIPGLALTGMEQVLHCALIVAVTVMFADAVEGARLSPWAYPLLAVAALTRYETAFVGAGLGAAQLVALCSDRQLGEPVDVRATTGRVAAIAIATGGPMLAFGLFNIAMGQELLPNSIIHKSALARGSNNVGYGFFDSLAKLSSDPVVLVCFAAAVVYVVATWHRGAGRNQLYATVLVVAVPMHSVLAQYGWFERYQAYLVALGVLFLLSVASETGGTRTAGIVAVTALVLTFALAPTKWHLLLETPTASKNTYVQRYQAGRFLARYYDGQPVATGELGYISYFHRGPLTDVFGLGDHEVLARREQGHLDGAYFEQLVRERHVRIVVVYPFSLWNETPSSWTLVGLWRLDIPEVTAFDRVLQFWAPEKSDVERIQRQLEAWQPRLPKGIHTEINPFSGYRSSLPAFPCC